MADGKTGFFRGAGGAILELPVPLSENMQNQADRGELVEVGPDGSPLEAVEEPTRPAASATKNAWVRWAVFASEQAGAPITVDDADAMTKNDLIEKYGE